MKIMTVWKTVPGKYRTTVEEFLRGGGAVPPGCTTLGRWHTPGSTMGWHLMEGDLKSVAQHVAEWADLLECEVYPVMEDADATEVVRKAYGAGAS